MVDNPVIFELHGFSDASQRAYRCCIYLRSVDVSGSVDVKLICGKSRVAPLKELNREEKEDTSPSEMTIPRLELCAADLLAGQLKAVREALDLNIQRIVPRSDSKIVLCWLKNPNPNLPVFVRNRIARIQRAIPNVEWVHIGTKDNPADLVSRGTQPMEMMKNELWWNGPVFLMFPEKEKITQFSEQEYSNNRVTEEFEEVVAVAERDYRLYEVIQNCSNFRKMERVFGYVIRFIHNCSVKRLGVERRNGRLSSTDYRDSLRGMVKIVQRVVYEEEIEDIQRGRLVRG